MVTSPATVKIDNLTFVAVPLDQALFDEKSAIYVILDMEKSGEFVVLDVGESPDAGTPPMNTPDRRAEWLRRSKGQNIWVGTYLEPAEKLFSRAANADGDRALVVEKLRRDFLAP